MTLEDRVSAVGALGFPPRRARFLVTVALHGGYFIRRQYEAFAGIQYGRPVRSFLDGLISRGVAGRFSARADRGYVYHVHDSTVYRAIGQEDGGNERSASAAVIARKLMVLDYVIGRGDVTWYATEQEKVDLFVTRFGVPPHDLPRRTFRRPTATTTGAKQYFAHNLPIYLSGESRAAVAHFVYLTANGTSSGLASFLRDHAPLFAHLPEWTVVAIGPVRWPGLRTTFDRFMARASTVAPPSIEDLRWYFERRRIVEGGDLAQIPVRELGRFRELRQRFGTPADDARYAAWLASGEIRDRRVVTELDSSRRAKGQLVIEALPFSYELFGSFPGVA